MGQLPQHIDPWRMAAEHCRVEGALLQSALPRLAAIVEYPQGMVKLRLYASRDSTTRTLLHGEVSTEVVLRCQRCLQPLSIPLQSRFTLAPVRSEQELDQLPKEFDSLVLENGEVELEQLVEDELLLALPIIPKHTERDCQLELDSARGQATEAVAKPFAALSELLAKRES